MIAEAKTGSKEVEDYVGTTSGYKQCTGIAHPFSHHTSDFRPVEKVYFPIMFVWGEKTLKLIVFQYLVNHNIQ